MNPGGIMKNLLFIFFAVSYIAILTSCTSIQRSTQSGYADGSYYGSREVSLADLAPTQTTERSPASLRTPNSQQMYRKNLESELNNSAERSQYLRYKPYMSEGERINFLQLDNLAARERWAQEKNLSDNPEKYSQELKTLIEQNDITLGMNKEAVRDSWGDPDSVDISGQERFENERWKFSVPVQTPEGFQIEERYVYFEGGRVVGWTTR